MSNLIIFPVSSPHVLSKASEPDITREMECMERARDQISNVLAQLKLIHDELAKAHTSVS